MTLIINEKPVRADIKQRFEEVVMDINLPLETEKCITLFNVHDLDVFHVGSTILQYSAIIGIPPNFEYKSADDITAETISFPCVNVDWSTEAGKEFRKSLILSDKAQKFILAQKILTCCQGSMSYEEFNLLSDILLVYMVDHLLHKNLHIFKNQRLRSFVYITLTAIGGYITWVATSNAIDAHVESEVNNLLLQLGPKYVEGAVEYYEKLSQRNKILRALLGVKGTYLFTPTGNQTSWFSQKGTSICNQLDYFKSKLQDIQLA